MKARFAWLADSMRFLDNWPQIVLDRVRVKLGAAPAASILAVRGGPSFVLHRGSTKLLPVFREVYCHGVYDRDPLFRIGPRDVVVDVGAHIGFFTVKAALAARDGRVLAFEPMSLHFALLGENVRRNGLRNVSLFNEAVWRRQDALELRYSLVGEPNATSLYDLGGDRFERVRSVTLAQVFEREGVSTCDFLKLDCEGAEYDILESTPAEVLARVRRVALEWHRPTPEHRPEVLVELLRARGFSLHTAPDWRGGSGYLYAHRAGQPGGS